MASRLCDSCESATATIFCRSDSAFLCVACDSKVHAANKLASRHARVGLCAVCEQAPAHVTCKADAAALCVTCDRDIHSANPLARRHERVPITPFYDVANSVVGVKSGSSAINFLDEHHYFSDTDADADLSKEEAEAASWLLATPLNTKKTVAENPDLNLGQFVFSETDPVPFLDLDYGSVDPKITGTMDGVVPVQRNEHYLDTDFAASKPFVYDYKYHTQSRSQSQMSHSVSSSSMDVGVVPDGNTTPEISNGCYSRAMAVSAADREARVLRYREKRKNRKFEKTIRYASRKAYAERRPRIKGRFAKRSDVEVDPLAGYGVVPTC